MNQVDVDTDVLNALEFEIACEVTELSQDVERDCENTAVYDARWILHDERVPSFNGPRHKFICHRCLQNIITKTHFHTLISVTPIKKDGQ